MLKQFGIYKPGAGAKKQNISFKSIPATEYRIGLYISEFRNTESRSGNWESTKKYKQKGKMEV